MLRNRLGSSHEQDNLNYKAGETVTCTLISDRIK